MPLSLYVDHDSGHRQLGERLRSPGIDVLTTSKTAGLDSPMRSTWRSQRELGDCSTQRTFGTSRPFTPSGWPLAATTPALSCADVKGCRWATSYAGYNVFAKRSNRDKPPTWCCTSTVGVASFGAAAPEQGKGRHRPRPRGCGCGASRHSTLRVRGSLRRFATRPGSLHRPRSRRAPCSGRAHFREGGGSQ